MSAITEQFLNSLTGFSDRFIKYDGSTHARDSINGNTTTEPLISIQTNETDM